jgi:polyphosphate kinase 2
MTKQGQQKSRRTKPSPGSVDATEPSHVKKNGNLKKGYYEKQLKELQIELVKLQAWVQHEGLRVVVLFEGRDAAGKGNTIKRITARLNPRVVRVVALPVPNEREKNEWYFQRYVTHLPTAGEICLFDRSWYNRALVERVMGFASEDEVEEFLRECPQFEGMLIHSGIILIKYWFSVSDEEQDRRFQDRLNDPVKRWKISDIDLKGRDCWEEFSSAKDDMMLRTDTAESPWWVIESDDKKRTRLNCINDLLGRIPYENVLPPAEKLPKRKAPTKNSGRVPFGTQRLIEPRF